MAQTVQTSPATSSRTHAPAVSWVRGVLPGLSIAVITLTIVEAAVLTGVIAGGTADLSIGAGLGLGAQLWLLSLGVPLEVSVSPVEGAAPQHGMISLAPLGLSLLTAIFAFWAGSRLARRAPQGAGLAGVIATIALTHALIAAGVAAAAEHAVVQANPLHAVAMGGIIVVLAAAIGALIGGGSPAALVGATLVHKAHKAGQSMRWAGSYLWAILKAAIVAVLSGIGLGALVLVVALVVGWQGIIATQQQLGSDAAADTVFMVLHLALLPNFVVWALAWVSGAGFYVGESALVSPAGSSVHTLPLLPIFGALPPHNAPEIFAVAPGLVVLCGLVAGWWFIREGENHLGEWIAIRIPWRVISAPITIVITGLLVGVVSAVLVAGLVTLASGSLGVGRLNIVGPLAWETSVTIGVEIAIGAAIGVAIGPWIEMGAAVRGTEAIEQTPIAITPVDKNGTQSRGGLERDREAKRRATIEARRQRRIENIELKKQKRHMAAEKRRKRRKAARDKVTSPGNR